ncbi:MAG: hypothetical protein CL928_17155 [Deltaproteobacteria bacterium]|nr:hypothetical protein [Deltaproteobacteria bacterium]
MLEGLYRGVTGAMNLTPASWWARPSGPPGPVTGLLHGASAGEVKAALATLPQLETCTGSRDWVVSTGTEAGLAMGAACCLPRDLPRLVDQFLDHLRPRAIVLVEAELWPNLLRATEERRIPVGVLGAQVSQRTARRWSRVPEAAGRLFGKVTAFAAASVGDAERLVSLGVAPERVAVTGWLKWPDEPGAAPGIDGLESELGQRFSGSLATAPLLVLGSVHPGELARVASALTGSHLAAGNSRWLVVPRHVRSCRALRREAEHVCAAGSVSVESRFGVLRSWYSLADAAFVGGGAAGRGVHNLLEPVQAGLRPLCFLERGDPAQVGEVLVGEGLAIELSGGARGQGLEAEVLPSTTDAWPRLRAQWDGREAGVRFLMSRGVLRP